MVGDGDHVHASFQGDVPKPHRIGEALGAANLLKDPLGWPGGKSGMDVEIYFHYVPFSMMVTSRISALSGNGRQRSHGKTGPASSAPRFMRWILVIVGK